MVSLLEAEDRLAIVEGTLDVSEGHGPWGTVLGTWMGGSEAGTASGKPREAGRVANISEAMSGEAEGFKTDSRVWEVDRAYWQLAEAVLMGVPPAQLLLGKPMRNRVARVWSGPLVTPSPEPACTPSTHTLPTTQPYPHSRWISGIKRHSKCGQVKGVVRG